MTDYSVGERSKPSLPKIAFATAAEYPKLTADDHLVVQAGAQVGLNIQPAIWNDPLVVWTDFDAVVIRSCWDYHLRPDAFLAWVTAVQAAGVALWNPPFVLQWNSDKRYLLDLDTWGIPTVPTVYLSQGTTTTFTELLAERKWADVVIKPAISASAFNTWRTTPETCEADQRRFADQLRDATTLIQPYMPEIEVGEWSLIYFNGHFSHAVLKRPPQGDFRVQGEFGGHSMLAHPGDGLIQQAADIIALVQSRLGQEFLYVRLDGIVGDGSLVIMELELIEPSLFIAFDEGAAIRFAHAILARVGTDNLIFGHPKAR